MSKKSVPIPDRAKLLVAHPDIEDIARKKFLKAWDSPISLRKCINAKCCDCIGFEKVVPSIRDCKIVSCPLWQVRPHRLKSV